MSTPAIERNVLADPLTLLWGRMTHWMYPPPGSGIDPSDWYHPVVMGVSIAMAGRTLQDPKLQTELQKVAVSLIQSGLARSGVVGATRSER